MNEEKTNVHAENEESKDVDVESVTAKGEGSIEYNAGSSGNPMEDLIKDAQEAPEAVNAKTLEEIAETSEPENVEDDTNTAVMEDIAHPIDSEDEKTDSKPNIIELKKGELPAMPKSKNPGFDPSSVQDVRSNNEIEGGIINTKTTEMMKEQVSDPANEGGQIIPDIDIDSVDDKYEIAGFTVEYSINEKTKTVQVRDYFDDIETAQASINKNKYLMPIKDGYKVAVIISGVPILCYNERQIYSYINEEWKRTV